MKLLYRKSKKKAATRAPEISDNYKACVLDELKATFEKRCETKGIKWDYYKLKRNQGSHEMYICDNCDGLLKWNSVRGHFICPRCKKRYKFNRGVLEEHQ